MRFELQYFFEIIPKIASKIDVTLQITLIATFFSLVIGVLLAVISYYRIRILYPITRVYLSFIRGTPLVAQLYFFYYGLAIYSAVIRDMTPITAVALVISLNSGAFMSESIRGALLSVDEGQKEAAYSLGISKLQLMRRIILPQAIPVAIPPLFNDIINLIKASSLSFMLGVADIMGEAKIEGNSTFRYFEIYAAVMLVYWVLILIFSGISKFVEKKCQEAY